MRARCLLGIAAAIAVMAAGQQPAEAASFDLSPINIVFRQEKASDKLMEKMTIQNRGQGDLTVQLRLYRWAQDAEGRDVYEETKDLVAFPKIVTVKKGEERLIRIGTQEKAGAVEKTYRIYVEEVPGAGPSLPGASIRLRSRVGVPVFLMPPRAAEQGLVESVGMQNGRLAVRIRNAGNAHLVLRGISISGIDGAGKIVVEKDLKGWYLLAGAARTYAADIPKEACVSVARIVVRSTTDKETLSGQLDVTREMCSP